MQQPAKRKMNKIANMKKRKDSSLFKVAPNSWAAFGANVTVCLSKSNEV